jgi:2-hydroxychromene-2-carboxylate isomerase
VAAVERPVFFYDVGSPWCWLAGEHVGGHAEWVPVLATGAAEVDRAAVERAADEAGLQAVVWPEPFPFDSRLAMLAATFAKQTGRAVAFSLAAMRQAFAAGRDLGEVDNVLLAAAACELHPRAVLKGVESAAVTAALDAAGARARGLGVVELPSIVRDGRILTGADRLAGARAGWWLR